MHVRTSAATCAIVGGALWAVTALRQPAFDAGRTPDEGEAFFRAYNLLVVAVSGLLSVALLQLRRHRRDDGRGDRNRAFTIGWWVVLAGHVLLLVGSLPAVALGGEFRGLVMAAQDVGFLGAVIAAAGAVPLGAAAVGQRRTLPSLAAGLFIESLPIGLLAVMLLGAVGGPG